VRQSAHRYQVYGLSLESRLALPGRRLTRRGPADVTLLPAGASAFQRTARGRRAADWFQCRRLPSGSTYLCWSGLFEFLISPDGRHIRYHRLSRGTSESFATYLLGQVLSFSLLALGIEPLHGTAVAVNGEVSVFLGHNGYGKSTLGAALLRLGCPVVTDDLVVLDQQGSRYTVRPGIPRLKLFPRPARALLGPGAGGERLNPGTAKLIVPLDARQVVDARLPLRALYVLSGPEPDRDGAHLEIDPLPAREAFFTAIRSSFNTIVVDRARLANQFAFASRLAGAVPVKRLAYPRRLSLLPAVCEAVLADIAG